MKKWTIWILAALMLAGCGSPAPQETLPVPSVSEETKTAAPAETMVPAATASAETEMKEPLIRTGTWETRGGVFGRFYIFDSNGISGQTVAFKNGETVKFLYKEGGEEILFTMPGQETPKSCHVTVHEDGTMTLEWEDQITETLVYVSGQGVEDFSFYTYEELCQMALEDYKSKNDPSDTSLMAAAGENGDGTVTVQIYQNLSGHNSTAAWYSVDRMTGVGINVSSGEPVELSK